ncbi:hypothetical protein CN151_19230 [Sinorhizobium meliloti]|uniref:hypothetical protein n=1 Tax=Rhizobium meliloti TaxID=382 RepID=UPI00059B1DAC|nr:hypothetical protein [Sinorhizobium meliloti]MQX44065.1 hypothetical protein [Sinorhizobium meliloti]RVL01841.1 hypothetical protein CN151_19230 [Sinorhizobium meliloti]RVM93238.1 hypothetical protein CN119_14975 [Sinorhizobium meliloti]RVN12643.1 hypothetical protein CN112_07000 [Sinorhizobium meliloti]
MSMAKPTLDGRDESESWLVESTNAVDWQIDSKAAFAGAKKFVRRMQVSGAASFNCPAKRRRRVKRDAACGSWRQSLRRFVPNGGWLKKRLR